MATFRYSAMTLASKKVSGKMEASDEVDLRRQLSEQQMYLLSCHALNKQEKVKTMKPTYIADLCRQLGTMLHSGISLITAVSIVVRREDNAKRKDIYHQLYIKLQEGYQMSKALELSGGIFPPLMVNMVKAAEASGNLDQTFLKLADQYSHENKLNKKVQSAMLYPLILLVVTIIVMIVVFTIILPKFFDVFNGYKIPLLTRIMFAIAKGFTNYWYWIVIGILVIIAACGLAVRVPKIKLKLDKFKVTVKGAGHLTRIIYTARFARSLASLYSAGVSMLQCLRLARKTVNNTYIDGQFDQVIADVRAGVNLSAAMDKVDGFDPKLASSIYIGEQAGRLDTMLNNIADDFDFEAEIATDQLITIIQPAMIILLGFLIGTVILSVMTPLYSLYSSIGG